jgi:hypothetical protein
MAQGDPRNARMPKVPAPCNVPTVQPKVAIAPRMPAVPAPGGGNHGTAQPKMAGARPPTPPAAILQAKMGRAPSSVIQCKGCLVCGHKHGAADCPTLVADGVDASGKAKYKACGCKSHSSKFDSGAKFNPGQGKRDRMLASKSAK